jgi:hypothetical protein
MGAEEIAEGVRCGGPDALDSFPWYTGGPDVRFVWVKAIERPEFESMARRLQDQPGEILTTSMVIGFHKRRLAFAALNGPPGEGTRRRAFSFESKS